MARRWYLSYIERINNQLKFRVSYWIDEIVSYIEKYLMLNQALVIVRQQITLVDIWLLT